jgi:hypothetical protein
MFPNMKVVDIAKAKFRLIEHLINLPDFQFNPVPFNQFGNRWGVAYNDLQAAAAVLAQDGLLRVARYQTYGGMWIEYDGTDEGPFFHSGDVYMKILPRGRTSVGDLKKEYLEASRSEVLAAKQQFEYWRSPGRLSEGSERWKATENALRLARQAYDHACVEVGGDPQPLVLDAAKYVSRDLHPLARSIIELRFTISNVAAKQGGGSVFPPSPRNEINCLKIQKPAETQEDLQLFLIALYEMFCEGATFPGERPELIHEISRLRVDSAHDLDKGADAVVKHSEIGAIYQKLIGRNYPTQIAEYQEVQWTLLKGLENFLGEIATGLMSKKQPLTTS